MANPVGPVFAGGFEEFVVQNEVGKGFALLFLPPGDNDVLQSGRKDADCYSMPERLQLTCNPSNNTYPSQHIYFVGVFDETTASPLRHERERLYG